LFIQFNNVARHNALSVDMWEAVPVLLNQAEHDTRVRLVVFTGAGEKAFVSGADISQFGGADDARNIGAAFHAALNAVADIPAMVIAAISGYALGGGCELALACDYRIASTKAVFGQPEILLGIIPGGGGTQRLPRVVGASRAKELMVTGRQVKSEEALRIGLADEVVEPEELMARALELAGSISSGASVAAHIIKRVVNEGIETDIATGLAGELAAFEEVFRTEDSQIGVKSFLENGPGKATFTGR
jgi:enoyl-CoA hydratase